MTVPVESETIPIDSIEFANWLQHGMENGWISRPFCNTHDLDPAMTEEEEAEWEAGGDPCQHVIRLNV